MQKNTLQKHSEGYQVRFKGNLLKMLEQEARLNNVRKEDILCTAIMLLSQCRHAHRQKKISVIVEVTEDITPSPQAKKNHATFILLGENLAEQAAEYAIDVSRLFKK